MTTASGSDHGPLAPLFAQVRGNTQHILEGPGAFIPKAEFHHAEDCPGCKVLAALSSIERHVQEMRAEVDRQLGRHLCYTSESARERFWQAVDAALPAREKGTE